MTEADCPEKNGERRSLERRLQSLEVLSARLDERTQAAEIARGVAKIEVDRRLIDLNNLHEQLTRERGFFVDRKEFESKRESTNIEVKQLQRLVYMGLGGLAALQVSIELVHYWHGPG